MVLKSAGTLSSTVVVTPAVAEIMMVGSQAPFTVVPVPGILAYISAGNAWVIRENTGLRQPVVTTGDLDGRVFSISPDGRWLLYTRSGDGEDKINSLWVARIDTEDGDQYDLGVENIIHFADWIPGSQTGVGYSTAEMIPARLAGRRIMTCTSSISARSRVGPPLPEIWWTKIWAAYMAGGGLNLFIPQKVKIWLIRDQTDLGW